ncbi:hypothetical protein JDW15_00870 [Aerococcaceae bacterium zg-ZJ1578]|uniref:hypothetical protein n=1 Tax=Aerococcaceae TaxID=186827 RepID=UPI0013BE7728|nr:MULTISPECIES: hypothetical protein [unclassified Facklamia]MBK0347185.1 hypothetical protein [Aerococcaceae bacterium zg-1578]MBR7928075.1 hypothetical protein [Aerococcaceae bacterium zg-ZUI334]QQD65521.1 hypothetical protein JDW14_09660 [Aerococcaceae bacterium zg-252]NEW65125.1 hypothetical protein [Facklamia sp. 252]NEW68655.1 hypothetical protein [Facklamia sp. 253]
MALKDEDTLMKRKRELEEAMNNLGLVIDDEVEEEVDELASQFEMDEEALKELEQQKRD